MPIASTNFPLVPRGSLVCFDVALNTGMHLGEMYGLMCEDIDLSLKALTVRLSKNGKARHVPLNKAALDVARTWEGNRSRVP